MPAGKIQARYHVGDTPMDIQAAIAAGAVPIGVATGIYSKEELQTCMGDGHEVVVLDNLSDVGTVMKVMGL